MNRKRFLTAILVFAFVFIPSFSSCTEKKAEEITSELNTQSETTINNQSIQAESYAEVETKPIQSTGVIEESTPKKEESHEHFWLAGYSEEIVEPYEEVEKEVTYVGYVAIVYCSACEETLRGDDMNEKTMNEHLNKHKEEGVIATFIPTEEEVWVHEIRMVPKTQPVVVDYVCPICNARIKTLYHYDEP